MTAKILLFLLVVSFGIQVLQNKGKNVRMALLNSALITMIYLLSTIQGSILIEGLDVSMPVVTPAPMATTPVVPSVDPSLTTTASPTMATTTTTSVPSASALASMSTSGPLATPGSGVVPSQTTTSTPGVGSVGAPISSITSAPLATPTAAGVQPNGKMLVTNFDQNQVLVSEQAGINTEQANIAKAAKDAVAIPEDEAYVLVDQKFWMSSDVNKAMCATGTCEVQPIELGGISSYLRIDRVLQTGDITKSKIADKSAMLR